MRARFVDFFRRHSFEIAVACVLLLGTALRFYDLSGVPTELIPDEIDLYNSARSIVTTGHDIDGTIKPFLAGSFTRNPPMYAPFGYVSSLVFGKSPFGLRFPAAAFGVITIVLIYGIALELTRRRDIALIAALVQATQPIFVHFSRVAWEPASELPFLLGGLYVLLRATRRDYPLKEIALGAILLGLTSYTYMAGWFYALLLGGGLMLFSAWRSRSARAWRESLLALAIWCVVSAPALWMLLGDPLTHGKIDRVATFANGISLQSIGVFFSNYFEHFRWSYLVTTGDPQPGRTWRYLVGFGAVFWWVAVLTAIGLVVTPRYVRERAAHYWLWLWFLAYPLGGALTNEAIPNAPRTLAGAPAFSILAALGFAALLDGARALAPQRLKRAAERGLYALFIANAALSVALFASFYFTQYVHVYSNAWSSGSSALFAAIRARSAGYARLCFSVYPAWFATDVYFRFYLSGVALQQIENATDPRCYLRGTLIASDWDDPIDRPGFTELTTIKDVDGNPYAVLYGRE